MYKTKSRIWGLIALGIILVLISFIFQSYNEIFRQIGLAFIASSILAFILGLPSLIKNIQDSAIGLLKNNNFLDKLTEKELRKLRTDCTRSLYQRNTDSANEKLNTLDNKIVEIFLEPYFEYYNICVSCQRNERYIEKTIETHFKLVNPKNIKCDILKNIRNRVIFKNINGVEDLRTIDKFQYIIDTEYGEFIDLTTSVQVSVNNNYAEQSSPYNVETNLLIQTQLMKYYLKILLL